MKDVCPPNKTSIKTSPIVRWLVVGVIAFNLCIIGTLAAWLYISFESRQTQAKATAQNLASILSQDIRSGIDTISLGLYAAKSQSEILLSSGRREGLNISEFLERLNEHFPYILALRETDEDGWLKYGVNIKNFPNINQSDRLYFSKLRSTQSDDLVVSKPLIAKIDKTLVLVFSRRVNYSNGSFAGVVYANMELNKLNTLLSDVNTDTGLVINIIDEDLGLIAQSPPSNNPGNDVGKKYSHEEFRQMLEAGQTSGTFIPQLGFGGSTAIVSYQKVDPYPLYLTVELTQKDYLKDWKQNALHMSGLGVLLIVITSITGGMVIRGWRLQLEATEVLAQEEEKFHTVADYTYDWEYWESEDYKILYTSPSCERLTGYTQQEFVDNPKLLINIVHPDDLILFNDHQHSLKNQEPNEIDFRIVRRDGVVRWMSHSCRSAYGRDGGYKGRRVTNRDVTDRRLFELEISRLAQAVEQSPTGTVITDADGNLLYTNQAYTRITGYSFADAYAKRSNELLSSELSIEQFQEILNHMSFGRSWGGVVQNKHKNGEIYWEQASASPIYDQRGKISSYLFLRTDITDRMHNEEELRRYKDHLEEEVQQRTADLILARNSAEAANQAKSVFLANMSHELRTPLNAILGFSSLMRKSPSISEKEHQNLDIINRSGEHLLTLINDVLDMAKIESGRVQLEQAAFDLGGMVRDVTEMMQVRSQAKGLTLRVDQSSHFPRYIKGDEARLRQILINLLGNAIKFTNQGGVTLRLGTKMNTRSHLLIEVEDTGVGIPITEQKRIFEPFVQLGEQGINKGTGLGLAITRQFVELMGGTIFIHNKCEADKTDIKGSVFHIELPLEEVSDRDVEARTETAPGDVIGIAPGQPNYRVLIVEDQFENQLLLKKLMEIVGIQTRVAGNGAEGVELFKSWLPHLIWMDHQMPVMDGVEAMKKIRDLPGGKAVKIVAVTASAFSEQRSELMNAGMDDFVRKPYRSNEIYDCITKNLGLQFLRDGAQSGDDTNLLNVDHLAKLPRDLLLDLKRALESLESERIAIEVERVGTFDKALQKTLTSFIDNFDYQPILKAIPPN